VGALEAGVQDRSAPDRLRADLIEQVAIERYCSGCSPKLLRRCHGALAARRCWQHTVPCDRRLPPTATHSWLTPQCQSMPIRRPALRAWGHSRPRASTQLMGRTDSRVYSTNADCWVRGGEREARLICKALRWRAHLPNAFAPLQPTCCRLLSSAEAYGPTQVSAGNEVVAPDCQISSRGPIAPRGQV